MINFPLLVFFRYPLRKSRAFPLLIGMLLLQLSLFAQHENKATHNNENTNSLKLVDRFGKAYTPSKTWNSRDPQTGFRQNANCLPCGHFTLYFTDMDIDPDTNTSSGLGFDDPASGADRRAVACNVFAHLSNLIQSSVTPGTVLIEVLPSSSNAQPWLAAASGIHALSTTSGFIDNGIFLTLQSGQNSWDGLGVAGFDPATAHGTLQVNFDNARPYFYNNTNPAASPGTERDFYSIILHEALHAMGIYSLLNGETANRESYFMETEGTGQFLYSRYDRFITANGDPLIQYNSPFDVEPNMSIVLDYDCPVQAPAVALSFDGPNTTSQEVYMESPWWDSNISHLNCIAQNSMPGNGYTMNPYYTAGNTQRHPHEQEVRILCDLGYTINTNAVYGTIITDPTADPSAIPYQVYNSVCTNPSPCSVVAGNDFYPLAVVSGNTVTIPTNDTAGEGYLDNDVGLGNVLTTMDIIWDDDDGDVTIDNAGNITFSSTPGFSGWTLIQYVTTCGSDDIPGNIGLIYIEVEPLLVGPCLGDCLDNGNVLCYGDFNEFQQTQNMYTQMPYPYFIVNFFQNTPDITDNNTHPSPYVRSAPGEYILLPFKHPIAPLCTLNFEYLSRFSLNNNNPVFARFYASENYPCLASDGDDNNINTTTTDGSAGISNCSNGTAFEPFVVEFRPTAVPGTTFSPDNFTWVNDTGVPINFLIMRGQGGWIILDDIVVTTDCSTEISVMPSQQNIDLCPGSTGEIIYEICNNDPVLTPALDDITVDYQIDFGLSFTDILIQPNNWFDNTGSSISNIILSPQECQDVTLEFISNVAAGDQVDLEFSADGFNGCVSDADMTTVTVGHECLDVSLNATIMLEGARKIFDADGNLRMAKDMNLPTTGPYPALGYEEFGGQLGNQFANAASNPGVIDWVFVELRDGNDETIVLHTRNALLFEDGSIVEFDENSTTPNTPIPITFEGIAAGNYFVAIRHRNHLDVMTNFPVAITGNIVNLNFTTGLLVPNFQKANSYTNSATGTSTTIREFYTGDLDHSGSIDVADRVIAWNERNTIGYKNSDCHLMDESTNAAERSMVWNNRYRLSNVPPQ